MARLALFLPFVFLPTAVHAADPVEFFESKIRPVLADHCYSCHSSTAKKLKGDLRLDSQAAWLKGGTNGPAVVPGKPDDSLLIPLEGRDGRILASVAVDDPLDRKRPTQDSLRVLELFAAAAGATIEEDRLHHQLVRTERLKALGEMAGG